MTEAVAAARSDSLGPDVSVRDAARMVLAERLETVRAKLGPAAELSNDSEPIHQLRVATRRAGAALAVFRERLPVKETKAARKQLRRLRRSAAQARDVDVFLATLESWAPSQPNVAKPGIHFLFGHAVAERRAAHAVVVAAIERAEKDRRRRVRGLIRGVKRGGGPLSQFAAPIVASLARNFSDAIDAADFDDAPRLHALRVAGKRVRYALEILTPSLPAEAVEPLHAVLTELQRILGIAHDNVQAIRRLDRLVDDLAALRPQALTNIRAGIHAFRSFHREQWAEQRAAFSAWKVKRPQLRGLDFGQR